MKQVGDSQMGDDPGMASCMLKSQTIEINPKHAIVKDIKTRLEGAGGGDDKQLKRTCIWCTNFLYLLQAF